MNGPIARVSTRTKKGDSIFVSVPGHIRALDGLRGVAILVVMLYHFTRGYINGAFHGVLYQVSNVGWCGVDLFFVLSGFLITGILCDAKDGVHYFQNFYMRRVLRIFPLYYGFLLVLFVLVPVEHQFSPLIRKQMGEQVWFWSYLTNFDYALTSHPLINDFHLAHFWSLAVEEQFYLVWPAVIFFCQPKTAIRISAICIGTALILRVLLEANHVSAAAIYNLTPCRMDSLAVGALCALLVRTDLDTNKLLKAARLTTLLAGSGLIFIVARRGGSDDYNPLMESIGYTFLAFFFGGITLLSLDAAENNVLSWLLSCPILVVFGLYSYAIYVFHYPLIRLFDGWFPVQRLSLDVHSRPLGLEVHVLASMLASLLIGVLSWNLYEKHFLNLKKYFVLRGRAGVPDPVRPEVDADRPISSRLPRIVLEIGIWFDRRPFWSVQQ
ncbi:MAG: acyltransferase [Candidatus Acidiferrum sp.]